jgi:hypothetical protein
MLDANITSWFTGVINLGFAVWVAVFLLTKLQRTIDDNIHTSQQMVDVIREQQDDLESALTHQSEHLERLAANQQVQLALIREVLMMATKKAE